MTKAETCSGRFFFRGGGLLALAAATALSGCSLSPDIGIGGVTKAEKSKNSKAEPATRYQDVEIRTEIRRSGVEIPGALCSAKSADVSVDFKSPARLRLPLRGASAPPLKIVCVHEKQGSASASIKPGKAVKSDGLFASLLGGSKPKQGSYLPRYTLQLVKRVSARSAPPAQALSVSAEEDSPPSALGAAMERTEGPPAPRLRPDS